MRTKAEIQKRLERLRYNHLKRHLRDHLSRRPENCAHNGHHALGDGKWAHLCMLGAEDPEAWPGNICDEEEVARTCAFFTCRHDKEALKREFWQDARDPALLEGPYRDVGLLMWVLDEEAGDCGYEADQSWWRRMRQWMGV